MNTKQTHPENWYIEVTKENFTVLQKWHKSKTAGTVWKDDLCIGHLLLSKHFDDTSYYWCGTEESLNEYHSQYKKITLEQFKQITEMTETINSTDAITIDRGILNQYYDAATETQREYLDKHFSLSGKTTVEAITGLYDIACDKWKPIIKNNHPECFPVTKSAIELAVENIGKPNFSSCEISIKAINHTDYIRVSLPNANTQWTFAAFEWVMKFCKQYPDCYPVHFNGSEYDNSSYLYIKWVA
jgi:hypothetical protein